MTFENFRFDVDADGIAVATFDIPGKSMNVLSASVISEIEAIADRASSDDAIKGVVITSGKSNFCAGADLKSLFGPMQATAETLEGEEKAQFILDAGASMSRALTKLEQCGKPLAACINGLALGGGLEFTLACHYRIGADNDKTKIGFPEVLIGLFPGAGGSQRLPRVCGAMDALQIMTTGKNVSAKDAVAKGIIHELAPAEELVDRAKAWLKAHPDATQPWYQKGFKIPGGKVWSPGGLQVFGGASPMARRETWGNYPAVRYLLSAVYEGLQVDINAGLSIEERYFAKLLLRPESAAMTRSIFLSKQALDKGARRPAGQDKGEIATIAVIGAGFMGAGIANVSAQAGVKVFLIDIDQEAADRGKAHAEKDLGKRVSRGRMDAEAAKAILERITPTTDYSVLSGVDMVIEAVFENAELKNKITKAAEAHLPANSIMATNTSTIPITGLAQASSRPENFIGVHFFSPVEKMPLVEIIVGDKTGDYAISRAIDLVGKIKKTPIVVKDTRGFYANRCVFRFIEQGHAMLAEGVTPALIENGTRLAGMPVGPLSLNDEVAIDLSHKIMTQTKKDLGDAYVPSPSDPIVEKMVGLERYGRKNAKGFYEYPEDGKKRLWPELGQFARGGAGPLPENDQPDVQTVKDRILITQALEAARCMEEGIVADPREADLGSIFGWGFAPFTGGVLSYMDTMGLANVAARADELNAKYPGVGFEVPALVREMAAKGETFYGRFSAAAAVEPVAAE